MEATEASNFELYFAHADSNLAPYLSEQNNHGNTVTTNTSDFSIPTIDGLAEDFYKLLKPAAEDQRELYGERVLNQDLRHVDIDAIVYQPNSDGVGGTVYAINNPNR
jgi:hypothetical protein